MKICLVISTCLSFYAGGVGCGVESATSIRFGFDQVSSLSGVFPTSSVGSDAWSCAGFMGIGVCPTFVVSHHCNVGSSSILMDKLGI